MDTEDLRDKENLLRLLKKYGTDELLMAAECFEEYGEFLHMDLIGYTDKELRAVAAAADFINNETSELCLEAVKYNGLALMFVENQTEEICLAAVKHNGMALAYVREQTPEIIEAALAQNPRAEKYVAEMNSNAALKKRGR